MKSFILFFHFYLIFMFGYSYGKVYASTSEYLKDNEPEKYNEFIKDSIKLANCPRIGTLLIEYANLKITTDSIVMAAAGLLDENTKIDCFVDDIEINSGSVDNHVLQGLTYTFGKICEKNNSMVGVKVYLDYVSKNINSAEEELSFALERLFVSKPDLFMQQLQTYKRKMQLDILSSLGWGFINNRYFGATDSYVDKDQKAFMEATKRKPVLNKSNYTTIFYSTNSSLKQLAIKYPNEFKYLLKEIKSYIVNGDM